jgi:membrane associated rhomboid family serine protease
MFPIKDNIPLVRFPLVTVALVAIDVIAYVLAIRHGGSFFGGPADSVAVHYGAIPYELTHAGSHCDAVSVHGGGSTHTAVLCSGRHLGGSGGQPATWATAFTSMFVHGSFLALFANMLFLAIFGPTVEDRIGRLRFPVFYLLGGLVALGVQVLVVPNSTTPALGAAGAIAAVLGGYLLLYPRARVLSLVLLVFFVTLVAVPAAALLGLWFAVQLVLDLAGLANPIAGSEGAAYLAQAGAFAFGLLAIRLFALRARGRQPLAAY